MESVLRYAVPGVSLGILPSAVLLLRDSTLDAVDPVYDIDFTLLWLLALASALLANAPTRIWFEEARASYEISAVRRTFATTTLVVSSALLAAFLQEIDFLDLEMEALYSNLWLPAFGSAVQLAIGRALYFSPRIAGGPGPASSEGEKSLEELLRERAAAAQSRSDVALLLIATVMALGAVVVVFAGKFVSTDAASEEFAQLTARERQANRSAELAATERAELRFAHDSIGAIDCRALSAEQGKQLSSILAPRLEFALRRSSVGSELDLLRLQELSQPLSPAQCETIIEIYSALEGRLEAAVSEAAAERARLEKILSTALEISLIGTTVAGVTEDPGSARVADSSQRMQSLIASGILRFGILALLLFFVQILVNIYRYSSRLAAFYNSRADSIRLLQLDSSSSIDAERLDAIVRSLEPHGVEFAASAGAPTAPFPELARITEGVIELAKDKAGVRPAAGASGSFRKPDE